MSSYPVHNGAPVAKKVESIYRSRLGIFLQKGQYKSHTLPKFYNIDQTDKDDHIKLSVWSAPGTERPFFSAASTKPYSPAKKGDNFGPSWTTHWFKVEISPPWKDVEDYILEWDCENEGMAYTEDGQILVGLSGEERHEVILHGSKPQTLFIETSCNGMFGNGDPRDNIQPPDNNRYFTLKTADLVLPNWEARALKYDFSVIADCAYNLSEQSWQRHRALEVASKIMDTFDEFDEGSISRCREIAKSFLGESFAETVKQPSKKRRHSLVASEDTIITAVGHCHIDTAWLWPYAETRRKIARSWSSQLDLMDRYPEYVFACSQAVQFQWLKEDYPQLFERIKAAVKEGRFLPIGGSWVESDMNIPSGESICRQFLYGQKFFEEEFGVECQTFWLPDTFGYSGQLPQICRLAGMDRFVTQKLSWNNINNFPHTTFNWVALDGTQVLCHMPPGDTYNSNCQVSELTRSVSNNKTRGICEKALLLFGFGDGGGGPTDEMIERLRRSKTASDKVGELPSISTGTVDAFFNQVIAKTDSGRSLPTWRGELYFEFHRGTYTSQAQTKRNNRVCEILMREIEMIAALTNNHSFKPQIDKLWQDVLLNQFHDVLPGSSIEMVYDDVAEIYQNIINNGKEILVQLLGTNKEVADLSIDDIGAGNYALVNTLAHYPRSEVIRLSGGKSVSVNYSANSCVAAELGTKLDRVKIEKGSDGSIVLFNGKVSVHFSQKGLLQKIVQKDLSGSSSGLTECGPIRYCVFEDHPLNWQAWDTEVYHLNKCQYLEEDSIEEFDYREGEICTVTIKQRISEQSTVVTTLSLATDDDVVKFQTKVDWHENCRFLKVEIPTDIVNDYASYDTMFGFVRRPTHYNTSWDVAKFEVGCHKFADLSDLKRGVAVFNDSKYGFAVQGSTMRLSLLRAPKAPDANADMGTHQIEWAIYPHTSGFGEHVVHKAYQFNHPLLVASKSVAQQLDASPIKVKPSDNIVVSTMKPSEDGKGIVIRVYESIGTAGVLSFGETNITVFKTDVREKSREKVSSNQVHVRPFEIATYYIVSK